MWKHKLALLPMPLHPFCSPFFFLIPELSKSSDCVSNREKNSVMSLLTYCLFPRFSRALYQWTLSFQSIWERQRNNFFALGLILSASPQYTIAYRPGWRNLKTTTLHFGADEDNGAFVKRWRQSSTFFLITQFKCRYNRSDPALLLPTFTFFKDSFLWI